MTSWHIAAPIERVWDAVNDAERWPSWSRYVEDVTVFDTGRSTGAQAVQFQVWRTPSASASGSACASRSDPPHALEGTATGDLVGTGRWSLTRRDRPAAPAGADGPHREGTPDGEGTLVRCAGLRRGGST